MHTIGESSYIDYLLSSSSRMSLYGDIEDNDEDESRLQSMASKRTFGNSCAECGNSCKEIGGPCKLS